LLVYDPTNANSVKSESQLVASFSEISALAGNSGQLSASDPNWSAFKVWVPEASGQGGQLYTLDQLGIVAINLNAQTVNQANNGNTILQNSLFVYANGTTGNIASVDFAVNTASIQSQASGLVSAMAGFAPSGGVDLTSATHATAVAATLTADPSTQQRQHAAA